jgi:hypothetical protein
MAAKKRSDTQLLILTGVAVFIAGLMVAGLLLFATRSSTKPKETPEFVAGLASTIAQDLKDGGPYFFPDPFGHDRGVWLALEHGKIVALQQHLPGNTSCPIKWRGSIDSFADCDGNKVRSDAIDRYRSRVGVATNKGALILNLTVVEPAPAGATTTTG